MKEITRIHIAKVAYDIELDAKKDIEQYMAALEGYANDAEILSDIEIRVTELLAEQGVVAGGVIASNDVKAVRAQLGEPSDFATEESSASQTPVADEPRRVYRDESNALVGGVLSGLGKFIGVEPLWARIIFIVLLLGSLGTAVFLYLMLWLIIPPARTAAEKLQMSGKPVTLSTIKEASRRAEPAVSESMRAARIILRFGLGTALVLGAIGSLIAIAIAVRAPFGSGIAGTDWKQFDQWWMPAAFGLFSLAGALLATLFLLLAIATFRKYWSKRIAVGVVALVVLGLLSFFGGVGTMWYGENEADMRINTLMQETQESLPSTMQAVKHLKVEVDDSVHGGVWVNYLVADTARWELTSLAGLESQFKVSEDGASATVKVVKKGGDEKMMRYFGDAAPAILNIYGPPLESFDARYVVMSSYSNEGIQEKLDLVLRDTNFNLGTGTYGEVTLRSEDRALVTLSFATIGNLQVDSQGGKVNGAVVRTLTVAHSEACPSQAMFEGPNAVVTLEGVTSGKMIYNGNEQEAKTVTNDCGRVIIGDEDNAIGDDF